MSLLILYIINYNNVLAKKYYQKKSHGVMYEIP